MCLACRGMKSIIALEIQRFVGVAEGSPCCIFCILGQNAS